MPKDAEAPDAVASLLRSRTSRPVKRDRILRSSQAEEISEAAFRYHLRQYAADQPLAPTCYLSLGGRDPSEAFMQRFRGHMPPVKPRSQCRVSAREGVTDQETREPGRIVEVTDLTWRTEGEVDVTGGYYEAPMRAADASAPPRPVHNLCSAHTGP